MKIDLERADGPEIQLFVFPIVIFCEGRVGIFSREGTFPKPAYPPFVVVFKDLGCCCEPRFPLCSNTAAGSAGWWTWFQTNKSIVSILGQQSRLGLWLSMGYYFEFGIAGIATTSNSRIFFELFFHLEHKYRKMPKSLGRRFSQTEDLCVTSIQIKKQGDWHSQDLSGVWVVCS